MIFEVRYENGASHGIDAEDFGQAAHMARETLKHCVPENFRDNLVQVSLVRRVDGNFCALCGSKIIVSTSVEIPVGAPVAVCTSCAVAVSKTIVKGEKDVFSRTT